MRCFILIFIYLKILTALGDEAANGEKTVECEYSDTDWQPLNTRLHTCDIFTQTIDSPDYKILYEPSESEKVEGLRFNDNKNLHFLPNNIAEIFPNLKGLAVSGTYLSTLSGNDLKGLTQLKYISFANSDLKVIEDDTFRELSELEELDFSDSNLRIIEERGLHGMTSLKTLYLGGNKLTSLQPKTFEGLTSLNSLSLELNHLEYIDENLFSTNGKLADIWLNKNRIIGLPFKAIENLPSFSYLDVQENPCIDGVFDEENIDDLKEILVDNCTATPPPSKIHENPKNVMEVIEEIFEETIVDESRNEYNIDGEIDRGLFTQYIKFMKSPDEVDDSGITNDVSSKTVECQFEEIHWKFSDLDVPTCEIQNQMINSKDFKIIPSYGIDGSGLKGMSFAQNKHVKFLPDNIGKFAPNLEEFSARNASLDVITRKNFDDLKNLKSLNLADNKIKFIDPDAFDDLVSLEELDLSGNEIETLDDHLFRKLKNLKTLRIGSNQMHTIHPSLFKNLRNLVNVSISHQQIADLNENTFKQNKKLKNIWMNSNKIKSLSSNMFGNLKDLEYVDLRDNKCIDKYYDQSKFSLMKNEIHENCGKGYKLKMGVKSEDKLRKGKKPKKEKKKKQKTPKQPTIDEGSDEGKEVICEYEDIFWPHLNEVLKTCVINDAIDDPNYLISANPLFPDEFVDGETIQAILFNNNKNVKYLPKNLHEVFPNLIEFSAANVDLESVYPQNLKGLKKLKFLDLSGNKLKHIDRDSFKDLTSLEELILDDNEIEDFDEETFTETKVLKKLRIKGNKLKRIEVTWFEDMPELEDISFDLSAAVHIDEDTFDKNPNLKQVEWNGKLYDSILHELGATTEKAENEIECNYQEVHDEDEEEMIEICEIDDTQVIDNSDYIIKTSPNNNRVKKLVIKDNQNIEFLPKNLGESFPFLEEIIIEGTPLDVISRESFQNLPHLKVLRLRRNKIQNIDSDTFDDLPQLEELDMSENIIDTIGDGAFYKLLNLKNLRLGNNRINSLDPNSLKFLTKLKTVSLPDNNISTLDRYIFRHNPDLEEIDLSGNVIDSLTPKIFEKLKKLKRVSMRGNKCLDSDFDSSQLSNLKNEISESCKSSTMPKEISCELNDVDEMNSDVVDITTCAVDEDAEIDEPGYKIIVDTNTIDPSQIKTLVIRNNEKIKHLPENIGELFPNLEELQVSHTSIDDIPENILKDLENVKNVDFSNNKIKQIHPNSFSGLDTIMMLNLSNNNIENIDADPFLEIPTVADVDLSGNNIKFIPKNFKNHFEDINFIYPESITPEGDDDEFEDVEEEEEDSPKEVTCNDINYDHSLKAFTCTLNGQVIDSPDYFLKMPKNLNIESFEMIGDNSVKYLPKNIHELYPNLKKMAVHNTSIEYVPYVISTFEDIESFDFSNNKIKSIGASDFDNFPKLKKLSLEQNEIDDIDEESFDLPNLEWLNLGGNKISTIPKTTFSRLPKLNWITFDDNDETLDLNDELFEPIKNKDFKYSITKNGNRKILSPGTYEEDVTPSQSSAEESEEDYEVEYETEITRKKKKKGKKILTHVIEEEEEEEDGDEDEKYPTSTEFVVPDELNCEYVTFDWETEDDEVESLYTCIIKEQPVTDNSYKIKTDPQNSKVTGLKIENNQDVEFLPYNIGELFPNLERMSVKHTKVSDVPADNFKNLNNLKVLDLSNNEIENLDPDMLNDSPAIEEINLSNNKIEELPDKIFENVPKLRTIKLDNNEIAEIDPAMFENLPELSTLSVEGNNLPDELDEELFVKNPLLKLSKTTTTTTTTTEEPFTTSPSNEVECQTGYYAWESSNDDEPLLFTCFIEKQPITDDSFTIKPTNYDSRVEGIKIENNPHVEFLPENIGELFPNIQKISVQNTSISEIPKKLLKETPNLKVLDVSNNKLEELDPEMFNETPVLEEIILNGNKIKEIPKNIFDNVPEIKVIEFENNEITDIDPEIFENLPKLKKISYGGNDIPDEVTDKLSEIVSSHSKTKPVDVPSFTESSEEPTGSSEETTEPSVKEIECDLNNSDWTSVDEDDDGLTSIYTCHIINQPITDQNVKIRPTPYNSFVNGLKIQNNENVKFLPDNIGEVFPNLEKMSVQNTSVSQIPRHVFDNLKNLKTLDLSKNKIIELDPTLLNSSPILEEIDLNGNQIREIPDDLFENVPELKTLNLDKNNLTDLNPKSFENAGELTKIYIRENQIPEGIIDDLLAENPSLKIIRTEEPIKTETSTESTKATTEPFLRTTTAKSSIKVTSEEPTRLSTTSAKEIRTKAPTRTTTRIPKTTTTKSSRTLQPDTRLRPQTTTQSPVEESFVTRPAIKKSKGRTTTKTTTPRSASKLVKCVIIYEPSEFENKNVIKCDMTNEEIEDPEVSFGEIPNGKQVEVLKLDNNKNIKYLPDNIAQIFPNLKEISGKNSGIDAILPGDFEDLKHLKHIALPGNEIKTIEPETFNDLKRLESVDLSKNIIEFIDEDAFENLPSLTDLNLHDNELTFIHPKIFENLPNLEVLNIEGNDIPSLNQNIFANNPKLKEVKHSIRGLVLPKTTSTTQRTPVKIFTTFTRLTTTSKPKIIQSTTTEKIVDMPTTTTSRIRPQRPLIKEVACEYDDIYWTFSDHELFTCDLSNVEIDNPNYVIKPSPKNKKVKGLSFVDNKDIKYWPQNIDKVFPKLVEISGYNTSIESIPKEVLKNLPKLRSLNLIASDVSSIDPDAFEDLVALENLELSNNKIHDLDPDTFKNVPLLKALYLNENKIKELDPKIFENLPELRNISLENNELTDIDKKLFGRNYELQNVWLDKNNIDAIDPTIFDGKRALEFVDLRENDCIDEIFEGYKIEGMRNVLRKNCKTPEEKRRATTQSSTVTTTSTQRPTYRTTTGRFIATQAPRRPPQIEDTQRITTRRPFGAFTQRPSLATTFRSYGYRTTSESWYIPTQREIDRTTSEKPRNITTTPRPRQSSRGPQYFTGQFPEEKLKPTKLVNCSFNYHEFPGTRPEIYTCFISDQKIDDPEYVIQTTPFNEFVTGVAIDDNKRVKYLPKNIGELFPNLEHLSAKHNSIDEIPNLKNLDKIKTLDLSDNNLSLIDPEMLKNLPNLEDLNLSGNQIPLIINGTFDNLPNLKNLDLSRNVITEVQPDIFRKIPDLRKVILDNNRITELPENIFNENPKLETVNLNGNKINTINPQTFENLPNLEEVNLEENPCISGSYKPGTFRAMKADFMRNCAPEDYSTSLYEETTVKTTPITPIEKTKQNEIECNFGETYSSSSNDYLPSCIINENKVIESPIWEIKETPANNRVKRFMIYENNNIEKLPTNLGESFPELNDIVVTDAPIKSLSPEDLKNLNKLKSFTITGSSIKVLEPETFKGAPNVEYIDLSGNNIRHVDDDAFKGIPHLKNLDLSGNKIPKITNDVLKPLPELKTLKLTGNDLQSIDGDLFRRNPKLYKVNIDENNLKSIDPDAFDRMPHLIDINLNKNDCIDRSFGTSNMHMLRKIVNENCQPYETLKNELRTCKKEIENCISRPNKNDEREMENLKDTLEKLNGKIKQLNIQNNKLRAALNAEKESLKKEIQKATNLEKELDDVKRSCAKVDDNHNMLIDLNCDYNEPDTGKYSCSARNLKIKIENSTIENSKGNHKRGKRDTDVNSLIISNQDVNYLPNGISNHFPYLNELTVEKSGLGKINQIPLRNLPHLNKLTINGNNIHQIEPNALRAVPQLEYLDLSQNNIMEIPIKFLEELPKLKVLNLNDNALLSLPQDIIPNANNLKTFTVSNNNLNFIDPRMFKRLDSAEVIDFTNNRCIDKKFNKNESGDDDGSDYMSFVGAVSIMCTNDDGDDGEDGFCKGRKL